MVEVVPVLGPLFDTVIKGGEVVLAASHNYYRASDKIKKFRYKVEMLRHKQAEWVGLFERHNLGIDHPAVQRLNTAVEMLSKEEDNNKKYRTGSIGANISKTLLFPSGLIGNLDDVIQAFEGILVNTREGVEIDKLLIDYKNKRFAPFSFPEDDKYVPVEDIVETVEAHLDSETPGSTMVWLHGESQLGKSAMVQYLAHKYSEEYQSEQRTNLWRSKFPGGVYFLACEKSSNLRLLLDKLWADFGLDNERLYPVYLTNQVHHVSLDSAKQIEDQQIDYVRRKIMQELSLRSSQKILIIMDNVWEKEVVDKLWFGNHKHVKYLVTSVKPSLSNDVTAHVHLTKPSMEEARQILEKYSGSGTWIDDKRLAKVQYDLIIQADYHPLVLAKLGVMMKNKILEAEPDILERLTNGQGMYTLVKDIDRHMDESSSRAAAVSNHHQPLRIVDSIILFMNFLSEESKTIIDLVAMSGDITLMNESVMKLMFHRIHGKSHLMYTLALAELEAQSILTFQDIVNKDSAQNQWRRLGMHELRRQCIRDKRKLDLEKRMGIFNSEGEEFFNSDHNMTDRLFAILSLLYFDEPWRGKALSRLHQFDSNVNRFLPETFGARTEEEELLKAAVYQDIYTRVLALSGEDVATCYNRMSFSFQKMGKNFLKALPLFPTGWFHGLSHQINEDSDIKEGRAWELATMISVIVLGFEHFNHIVWD